MSYNMRIDNEGRVAIFSGETQISKTCDPLEMVPRTFYNVILSRMNDSFIGTISMVEDGNPVLKTRANLKYHVTKRRLKKVIRK